MTEYENPKIIQIIPLPGIYEAVFRYKSSLTGEWEERYQPVDIFALVEIEDGLRVVEPILGERFDGADAGSPASETGTFTTFRRIR